MSSITDSYNWSVTTCNNDNVGYSQTYRNQRTVSGITYYDCSSFIWYALKEGGFDVESAYKTATGSYYSGNAITTAYERSFLKALGFQKYNINSTWSAGDILWRKGHTEMVYSGGTASGVTMGAHSSKLPLADQVSINDDTSYASSWTEIYRYNPTRYWYAKPSGAFALDSDEAEDNIWNMFNILSGTYSYTKQACAGVIGNCYGESGLNPWRWQSDIFSTSLGCGLFGFTPATDYLVMEGSDKMNLSVTEITSGASPTVGAQQTKIVAEGTWGWVSTCWRTYWDKDTYPLLYAHAQSILSTWGDGTNLTQSQFANIDNVDDATLAFLACFEGPAIPNYTTRKSYADEVYEIIKGGTPEPEPTPPPIPPHWIAPRSMPIYFYLRGRK